MSLVISSNHNVASFPQSNKQELIQTRIPSLEKISKFSPLPPLEDSGFLDDLILCDSQICSLSTIELSFSEADFGEKELDENFKTNENSLDEEGSEFNEEEINDLNDIVLDFYEEERERVGEKSKGSEGKMWEIGEEREKFEGGNGLEECGEACGDRKSKEHFCYLQQNCNAFQTQNQSNLYNSGVNNNNNNIYYYMIAYQLLFQQYYQYMQNIQQIQYSQYNYNISYRQNNQCNQDYLFHNFFQVPQYASIIQSEQQPLQNQQLNTMQLKHTTNQETQQKNNEIIVEDIKKGTEKRTTVMIKNIITKYRTEDISELLDKIFKVKTTEKTRPYDLIYLPPSKKEGRNIGFVFVNFIDARHIITLIDALEGVFLNPKSKKMCHVSFGDEQGKEHFLKNISNKQGTPVEFFDTENAHKLLGVEDEKKKQKE